MDHSGPIVPGPAFSVGTLSSLLVREVGHLSSPSEAWTLVDFPMHLNCGDSALFLGACSLARALGQRVTATLDRQSYSAAAPDPESLLVLQAGGNWGGLYETHHRLRLRVLEDHRGRPVLQLPQSIQYASEERREELRRAVSRHGRVTLLVRDQRSFDVATRDYDCEVRLTPDLAFALPARRVRLPREGLSVQGRLDRETSGVKGPAVGALGGVQSWDWLTAPKWSLSQRLLSGATIANKVQMRSRSTLASKLALRACTAQATANVRRGVGMLAQGRHVVTDRLHGHILCLLHEIPHVVVDDRYGKISSFRDTWSKDAPQHEFVSDWADVDGALDRLRNGLSA